MTRSSATTGSRARALATSAGRGLMSVLLLAILAAMVITFAPSLFGYQRYVLVGHSMEPTIHRGSLVFDEIVRVSDLRKGDIITYVPPGSVEPVTHRLVSRKDGKKGGPVFSTKGDNNAVADPRDFQLHRPTQARYAFSVPYLGWLFIALGTPRLRFILLVIPALLIALSMVGQLWREGGRLAATRREAA
jgi:signal peptidase